MKWPWRRHPSPVTEARRAVDKAVDAHQQALERVLAGLERRSGEDTANG